MDAGFWHQKWETADIGFHKSEANPLLVAYFHELQLQPGDRVFLPLCGKTKDIGWLLQQGLTVVGAELSPLAVDQLFAELNSTPKITKEGPLNRYEAGSLTIFQGDIFQLQAKHLEAIKAVYDRAAFVALPGDMRPRYAQHLLSITNQARQLLITFEYDQTQQAGPPFSITEAEIKRCYGNTLHRQHLTTINVEGGLKGLCEASEVVWLLSS